MISLMGCKTKNENLKIESGEDESDSWIIKDGPDGPSVGFVAKEVSADELASVEEDFRRNYGISESGSVGFNSNKKKMSRNQKVKRY